MLQRCLTSLKLLLVLVLFIVAMMYVSTDRTVFIRNLAPNHSFQGSNGMVSFFSAMIACLWSFDGWADLNFLMEEIVNPEKQLPRIVLSSLCTVTLAYLLANVAYFSVLDTSTIISSKSIGELIFYFSLVYFSIKSSFYLQSIFLLFYSMFRFFSLILFQIIKFY